MTSGGFLRRVAWFGLLVVGIGTGALGYLACSSPGASGACTSDGDGNQGGSATLDLSVSDTAFTPTILKSQNLAQVTLTLKNTGTKPHDFIVGCVATPNTNGCPTTSCFPDASVIGPIPPDASATATFVTPNPEGIYDFRSDLPGDTQTGQFVVQ
jgi:hypothetical protein